MSARKGRKSAYETVVLPNIDKIKEMINRGALDKEIYSALGISKSTWINIKNTRLDFSNLIENGRMTLVKKIENAMYESAIGGITPCRKGMKVKRVEYEDGKKIKEYEEVQQYIEDVYTPPNPSSGKFLLMNWSKDKYTNDPQSMELKKKEFEHKKEIDKFSNF